MSGRSLLVGGVLSTLVLALLITGCAKKTPVVEESMAPQPVTDAGESERERQERLRREAELAERERRLMEESMRRRAAEQQRAGAMSREDFVNRDILFAFDSSTLSSEAKTTLEQKGTWLSENPQVTAQIEGHCDERGTTAYNLALGDRRAFAAKQYLTTLGVASSRLTTISYGEERPLDPGHNEAAWARNRRAHFVITSR
ncbi:MAG TPA: peptidoglycan-associated lipoprotein Pal [Candidatus Tectomicrobia bacterium]|jgi:peptidoglycan-associated lipoprotein